MIQFFSNGLKFLSATSVSSSSNSAGIVYTYTSNANELVIINGIVTSSGSGFRINLDGINLSGFIGSQGGSFVVANGAQFKIETASSPSQATWDLKINRFTIQG